ncbi:hypothetical protein H5410_014928 [Solanum commersonii]|uniref:Uncharacterized protein n=1 Tax=Solanum commersonii TaxID=4109 RepID=A0A9J5ZSE6_SOLCO|nr:hypothetical protein H5410_014928 [Solanum commersonii]
MAHRVIKVDRPLQARIQSTYCVGGPRSTRLRSSWFFICKDFGNKARYLPRQTHSTIWSRLQAFHSTLDPLVVTSDYAMI